MAEQNIDYKNAFDTAFKNKKDLWASEFLWAVEKQYWASWLSEAQRYLKDTVSYSNPAMQTISWWTELKPVEQPKPTEVQLPEQKQRVYTDTGYIDMNSQDYQNYLADKSKRASTAWTSNKEWNLTQEQQATEQTRNLTTVATPTQQEKTTVTTPQVTTTTVKETPKPTVDKTVRNNEIVANLNEWFRNDETIKNAVNTWDWNTFKSAYNMADPEEAKIVEAYFQARQPKDVSWIFNILKTWQKIYNQNVLNNPQYKTAKDLFDDYGSMKSFTSSQFGSALSSWELVKWSQLYNELIKDPVIAKNIANAEKLNVINKKPTNTDAITLNQTDKILSKNTTLKGALEDWIISSEEFKALSSSPEIDSVNKEVVGLKNKYDTLKRTYDNIDTDVENELKGKWASSSYMAAKIAERRKNIYRDLLVAQDVYNNKLWYLTDLKKSQADLFNLNLGLYEKQSERDYNAKLLQEQRTYQEKQANREFDLQYGDINSTDPRIRLAAAQRAVDEVRKTYEWMPFVRSSGAMANDILSLLDKNPWMTLSEAINQNIVNPIQKSPNYNQWAIQKWLISKPEKATTPYTIEKIWDNQYVSYNKETWTYTPISWTWTWFWLDFSTNTELQKQYPTTAAFKNNNPTWMTWGISNELKNMFDNAWIKYSLWTSRPKAEWWNYIKFATVEDWMKAYQIALTQRWDDIYSRLKQWVWTANWDNYASNLMQEAWIKKWTKFSQLDDNQLNALMSAQLWQESPWFIDAINKYWWLWQKWWYWNKEKIFDAIFNFSWWAAKVSEAEMWLMEKRAKTFADMWLTPQQAILKYKWLDINNNIDISQVVPYISIWDNLSKNVKPQWYESTISKYINSWDTKWLNNYVNRLVDTEVSGLYKKDAILSWDYFNWAKRSNDLINLISNNKDKLWIVWWNKNDIIKKFEWTPDYQKIKTLLQMSQADVRKYYAWSAVTETEMKALEDFIWWKTTDNPDNLITMLKTLQEDRTNLFNSQRQWLLSPNNTQTTTTTSTTQTKPTQPKSDMFKTKYWFSYKSNTWVWQTDLNNKIQELRKKWWSNKQIIDEAAKDWITLKF